jgi:hypothetical protein
LFFQVFFTGLPNSTPKRFKQKNTKGSYEERAGYILKDTEEYILTYLDGRGHFLAFGGLVVSALFYV